MQPHTVVIPRATTCRRFLPSSRGRIWSCEIWLFSSLASCRRLDVTAGQCRAAKPLQKVQQGSLSAKTQRSGKRGSVGTHSAARRRLRSMRRLPGPHALSQFLKDCAGERRQPGDDPGVADSAITDHQRGDVLAAPSSARSLHSAGHPFDQDDEPSCIPSYCLSAGASDSSSSKPQFFSVRLVFQHRRILQLANPIPAQHHGPLEVHCLEHLSICSSSMVINSVRSCLSSSPAWIASRAVFQAGNLVFQTVRMAFSIVSGAADVVALHRPTGCPAALFVHGTLHARRDLVGVPEYLGIDVTGGINRSSAPATSRCGKPSLSASIMPTSNTTSRSRPYRSQSRHQHVKCALRRSLNDFHPLQHLQSRCRYCPRKPRCSMFTARSSASHW